METGHFDSERPDHFDALGLIIALRKRLSYKVTSMRAGVGGITHAEASEIKKFSCSPLVPRAREGERERRHITGTE